MTPLDLIREGVTKGEWTSVIAGYRALTGVELPPPQSATGFTTNDLERIINAGRQAMLEAAGTIPTETPTEIPWEEEEEEEEEFEIEDEDDEDEEVNQLIAQYTEDEEDEDSYLMRQISKIKLPAPPKPRPPAPRVNVECGDCHKTYSVPPSIVPAVEDDGDRLPYICSSCQQGKKTRRAK